MGTYEAVVAMGVITGVLSIVGIYAIKDLGKKEYELIKKKLNSNSKLEKITGEELK